ncbi:MAG: hypothetical protein RDV48_21340 [Candidatus Eremiobacteraeota bacterium]|nr:hypothetical protein [Candidatus Eremiobacteraeota bacterium]
MAIRKWALSLLPKDEQRLISQMRELGQKGMSFKGYYDGSELTVLKGMKGELGKAFVRHKGGNESVLDDPRDFQRLKAIYFTGDLQALPKGEKDIVESINFMKDQGYGCAVLYQGKTEYAEPFDVLKAAVKGHKSIGFVDREQAFTEISVSDDLADLKAIHCNQGLESYSKKELKLISLIQDLMGKGYTFQADTNFANVDSLGNKVSVTRYYPVGVLAVLKGLRCGNTNLWLYKDNTRIPISQFLDTVSMFDKIEELRNEEPPPPESSIREDDGFVIIGGVRLPVKG